MDGATGADCGLCSRRWASEGVTAEVDVTAEAGRRETRTGRRVVFAGSSEDAPSDAAPARGRTRGTFANVDVGADAGWDGGVGGVGAVGGGEAGFAAATARCTSAGGGCRGPGSMTAGRPPAVGASGAGPDLSPPRSAPAALVSSGTGRGPAAAACVSRWPGASCGFAPTDSPTVPADESLCAATLAAGWRDNRTGPLRPEAILA